MLTAMAHNRDFLGLVMTASPLAICGSSPAFGTRTPSDRPQLATLASAEPGHDAMGVAQSHFHSSLQPPVR